MNLIMIIDLHEAEGSAMERPFSDAQGLAVPQGQDSSPFPNMSRPQPDPRPNLPKVLARKSAGVPHVPARLPEFQPWNTRATKKFIWAAKVEPVAFFNEGSFRNLMQLEAV